MTQQQNDLRAELYHKYLAALPAAPFEGQLMPYEWGQLPKPLHMGWMVYDQMFQEFSTEIANALNQLTNHLHRLRAWDLVLPSLNDDETMEALDEFIEPIATVALSLPMAFGQSSFLQLRISATKPTRRCPAFNGWTICRAIRILGSRKRRSAAISGRPILAAGTRFKKSSRATLRRRRFIFGTVTIIGLHRAC
jgi:hypothetical protein